MKTECSTRHLHAGRVVEIMGSWPTCLTTCLSQWPKTQTLLLLLFWLAVLAYYYETQVTGCIKGLLLKRMTTIDLCLESGDNM